MLRKNYFILLSAIGIVLLSTVFASAQIVNIIGQVVVEKEGGAKEPVENALVEIYNVATSAGSRKDKTDKKGMFNFVGIKPGATYIIVVSGEGLEPVIIPGIPAGKEDNVITVKSGNGATYTEDEVRAAVSTPSSGGGDLTAEQKKELEELEKKRTEIEAKNKKAEQFNTIVNRVVAEGEKAFKDKNYDLAIVKYKEGYEAGEDFLGSAPGFLNNMGVSYKARAIDNHNASVKAQDQATKVELRGKAKDDFQQALIAFSKSVNLLKTGKPEGVNPETLKAARIKALADGREVIALMLKTEYTSADVKDDAILIIDEYVKDETDKQKRLKAHLDLGLFLTRVYDFDGSVVAYRKALEVDSNDVDALAGIGLSLYTAGEANDNMAQRQESLNYMQYYLDIAPKDHSFRSSIEGVVDDLKSKKMKPQKISKN